MVKNNTLIEGHKPDIGIDIIKINRFRKVLTNSRFLNRVFSERELDYCFGHTDPAPHLAATFAGKEALLKAIGLDLGLSFHSVEILRDEKGAPEVIFPGSEDIVTAISLSHSRSDAVAIVFAASPHTSLNSSIDETLESFAREITVKMGGNK